MPRHSFFQLILLLSSFLFFCGLTDIKFADVQTAIIKQDYEKAARLAQDFIDRKPEKTQLQTAQYYLGLSRLKLKQYPVARKIFQDVLDRQPSRSLRDLASLGIIDSQLLEGSFDAALKNAQQLLKENPQSEYLSLIYFKIGRAQYKLAQWEQATNTLKLLRDRFPDSPETQLARQLMEEKHYFAVQVGSFQDQELAEKLMQDLRNNDKYAYVVETLDKSSQKYYRVRIGQFSRLDEAMSMARKLSQLGYPTLIYP